MRGCVLAAASASLSADHFKAVCQMRKSGLLRMARAIDHQLSDKRKPDPERRAAVIPVFCPYLPIVRLDNGARDGQPHAHAFGLAGEERLEDLVQVVFGNSWTVIRYGEFGKVLGARTLNADDAVLGQAYPSSRRSRSRQGSE